MFLPPVSGASVVAPRVRAWFLSHVVVRMRVGLLDGGGEAEQKQQTQNESARSLK